MTLPREPMGRHQSVIAGTKRGRRVNTGHKEQGSSTGGREPPPRPNRFPPLRSGPGQGTQATPTHHCCESTSISRRPCLNRGFNLKLRASAKPGFRAKTRPFPAARGQPSVRGPVRGPLALSTAGTPPNTGQTPYPPPSGAGSDFWRRRVRRLSGTCSAACRPDHQGARGPPLRASAARSTPRVRC